MSTKELEFIRTLNELEDIECMNDISMKDKHSIEYFMSVKCVVRNFLKKYPITHESLFEPDKDIVDKIESFEQLGFGAYGIVYKFKIDNFFTTIKINLVDSLNDYIIGLGLNRLIKTIPNFMYTYAGILCSPNEDEDSIEGLCQTDDKIRMYISEYIEGEEIYKIRKKKLSLYNESKCLIDSLTQVFCSIWLANKYLDFTHGDLNGGNIMITRLEKPILLEYDLTGLDRIVKLETNCIAKIIDYGKSSINNDMVLSFAKGENIINKNITNQEDYIEIISNLEIKEFNDYLKIKKNEIFDTEGFMNKWLDLFS